MAPGSSIITRGNAPALIENNIFYKPDEVLQVTENWGSSSQIYDHNLFYNFSTHAHDPNKQVVAKGTPVISGDSAAQVAADGKARRHDATTSPTIFDNFKPLPDSPAVKAGKTVIDTNGNPVEHDFFGRDIPAHPTIGAAEAPDKTPEDHS